MSRRVIVLFVLCFTLVTVLALPAFAQDTMPVPENAIASGLNNPRNLSFDADGNLWIAEAGNGGETFMMESEMFGTVTAGLSSQVSMVAADGTQSVVMPFMFGAGSAQDTLGTQVVVNQGDVVWLVISGGGPGPQPFYGDLVIKVTNVNGNWRIVDTIDMYANEAANNPDGNDPLDSNVNNIAWNADGTMFIVDTGANTIFTYSEDAGLVPWHIWPDNPVPTAIRFAEDGTAYVSFLGTGIAPGAGHIEHWSADGTELIETFEGLTAVTDLAIGADGSIYAVQLLTEFGEQGPNMMSGAVVMVSADGVTPIAEGLLLPYGITVTPDGALAVSIGTLAGPGAGAVIVLDTGM